MSRRIIPFICLVSLIALTLVADARAESGAVKPEARRPLVQIAILLDNSGSMSGLINQARSELWKVVNEFVTAKVGDQRPLLQVAIYHYGNPPATKLVGLTDDLDRVSEVLFGIPVSGGSEYCGQVIQTAVNELEWSDHRGDLKLIFIAGNEPFTQGPVDYREACSAAAAKGITINTIHCGTGIPDDWRDGALLADGQSMNIDHTQAVVHIEAPQDKTIAKLGIDLNNTYIAYGKEGKAGAGRQAEQDENASASSVASSQQRAVAKANAFYNNAAWDLCDAVRDNKVDLAKIAVEDLPEAMREMTLEQRVAYVAEKQKQRDAIKKMINELNAARTKYVADKRKEMAEDSDEASLDEALIEAIRDQATKKEFSFGSQG